jgi:hypothetical protein
MRSREGASGTLSCLSLQRGDHWSWQLIIISTGSFEWTTSDPRNAYVDAEGLHIIPTLTIDDTNITEAQLLNGYTLNLTTAGTCTSPDPYNSCSIYSNSTSGAIINPVRSARLTTMGKKTIRYGRVEVVRVCALSSNIIKWSIILEHQN